MKKVYLSGFAFLLAAAGQASAETAWVDETSWDSPKAAWAYKELADKFTDKPHYIASFSSAPSMRSEKFKVNFECRNGKDFVFSLYSNRNLGERNLPVKLQYRVDNKHAKTVKLLIFSNTETGGMNKYNALEIANGVLNAERFRLRITASNGDLYDTELSLENARQSILKTVNACGLYVR